MQSISCIQAMDCLVVSWLITNDDGYLILPDPDAEGDMKLAKMEQLIWAFMTIHYSKPLSF